MGKVCIARIKHRVQLAVKEMVVVGLGYDPIREGLGGHCVKLWWNPEHFFGPTVQEKSTEQLLGARGGYRVLMTLSLIHLGQNSASLFLTLHRYIVKVTCYCMGLETWYYDIHSLYLLSLSPVFVGCPY